MYNRKTENSLKLVYTVLAIDHMPIHVIGYMQTTKAHISVDVQAGLGFSVHIYANKFSHGMAYMFFVHIRTKYIFVENKKTYLSFFDLLPRIMLNDSIFII